MACEDGGLARRVAGADQFRSAPIYRSESPTGYSSAGCSPAEPASASPVTDNSSPNPIQRANQIALLNSTAGCRQTRAPRPLPSARGGCHLYFARRVTFLSCADKDGEKPQIESSGKCPQPAYAARATTSRNAQPSRIIRTTRDRSRKTVACAHNAQPATRHRRRGRGGGQGAQWSGYSEEPLQGSRRQTRADMRCDIEGPLPGSLQVL